MMKAVLIDDERPALRGLESLLKNHYGIKIAGMFINPLEAIEKIADIKPQIVFLDINMPQLQGIDAASRILDQCSDTDIIFVTAYDQYAIEAFELHALDYVLKPVSKERFEKTIQRVIKKNGNRHHSAEKRLVIKSFGRFQIGWFGEEPLKWRTRKTRELFAFLLHHQGREVSKDEILDNVWPEVDVEKAVHQLYNGIYCIRKTLDQYGIGHSLISISGNYIMKLSAVESDVVSFRELLKKVNDNPLTEDLEALDQLYVGEYFEGTDWPWADFERESFSRQYNEVVISLCQAYIGKEKFKRAEELLLKGFARNPYDDRITEFLLNIYRLTGDKVKAARHYTEYNRLLKEELGIKPEENLQKIYASIK